MGLHPVFSPAPTLFHCHRRSIFLSGVGESRNLDETNFTSSSEGLATCFAQAKWHRRIRYIHSDWKQGAILETICQNPLFHAGSWGVSSPRGKVFPHHPSSCPQVTLGSSVVFHRCSSVVYNMYPSSNILPRCETPS